VVAFIDDGSEWAGERLAREPGLVLDSAIRHGGGKTFAAYLHSVSPHEIADLRLGKRAEAQLAEAERVHKQLDRYAYGPPQIRFNDSDVAQARAARVLIAFEQGRPIIVERPLYRELVKGALNRTVDELAARAAAAAEQQKRDRRAGKPPADPLTAARRERDRQLRELADQAHGANLDLGAALLTGLSTVDPADMNVARFFVLCGRRHRTNHADRLTMRISRCRTRGNGDEAGARRGQSTQRSRWWRGGGRIPARLDGPLPRGARLLTPADLGRRRSLRRWPRLRAQRRGHARNRRRSSSHSAAAGASAVRPSR
jgi:hypothetical protein